jgi:hypothetical protein
MCSDGWNYPRKGEPVDGECPDCGEPKGEDADDTHLAGGNGAGALEG